MTSQVHDRQARLVRDGRAWDQELLRSRTALVCGAGNVGDPLAIMLARLGFARVDCADRDVVEAANLSRGVTATPSDVGRPKAEVVSAAIERLCPDVATTAYVGDLRCDWPCDLPSRYDLVMLATHDLASRLFVNRMVHRFGGRTLAVVEGGLTDLSFAVQTIVPGRSPCYECGLSPDLVDMDRWQGCGGVVVERDLRPAATTGPTGMAVAAVMAGEAGLVGAGLRPSWPDHRFEFDGDRCVASTVLRSIRESCTGHRPASDRVKVACGPDPQVRVLREAVAGALRTRPCRVALYAPRLMIESVTCGRCGRSAELRRCQAVPVRLRCECGSADPDQFVPRLLAALPDDRRLTELGLPAGEVVEAYVLDDGGDWNGPRYVHT